MKRILLLLCLLAVATSCGVGSRLGNEKVTVGICKNGSRQETIDYFKKCVKDAGAKPCFFPIYATTDELAKEFVSSVDAVIIPGKAGGDTTGRAKYDKKIIREALAQGKPMLGICLGHQEINQVYGGGNVSVAKSYPESTIKHMDKVDGFNQGLNSEAHPINIDAGSRLSTILDTERTMVNTSHNFSIGKVGKGLTVTAKADDGVIECIEDIGHNVMGVQFHPEYLYGKLKLKSFLPIFGNLVDEARGAKMVVVGVSKQGCSEATLGFIEKSLREAGAVVVFFPYYALDEKNAEDYMSIVDALLIPGQGGKDTVARRECDFRMIKAAINQGKPVLGICEGHQEINRYFGGTTEKLSKTFPDTPVKHKVIENGENVGARTRAHAINIEKSSRLYKVLKKERIKVNTSHYYSAYKIGEGVNVTATADDGVVEAIEVPEHNIMGVQFHPEYLYGRMGVKKFLSIFKDFVEEARQISGK
ncbi:MAG: gamma-glutamyl-gamma-aminobutyrate hydrolase family protein [Bacteroidales bacterium]|nr:gamma-glutamyl-gamma-aminobutyrate hydrolase family protein [Bacteroidales bacterium]